MDVRRPRRPLLPPPDPISPQSETAAEANGIDMCRREAFATSAATAAIPFAPLVKLLFLLVGVLDRCPDRVLL